MGYILDDAGISVNGKVPAERGCEARASFKRVGRLSKYTVRLRTKTCDRTLARAAQRIGSELLGQPASTPRPTIASTLSHSQAWLVRSDCYVEANELDEDTAAALQGFEEEIFHVCFRYQLR
jgi:hypothetical protein